MNDATCKKRLEFGVTSCLVMLEVHVAGVKIGEHEIMGIRDARGYSLARSSEICRDYMEGRLSYHGAKAMLAGK